LIDGVKLEEGDVAIVVHQDLVFQGVVLGKGGVESFQVEDLVLRKPIEDLCKVDGLLSLGGHGVLHGVLSFVEISVLVYRLGLLMLLSWFFVKVSLTL
jgi:hypothetical protein